MKNIKIGVIACGGEGSRLSPYTTFVNKGLVGINGKFIVDYPLNTLRKLGVRDLIVILGGSNFSQIVSYIKDGKSFGFSSCSYVYQEKAEGISQAINLCSRLINDEQFYVILGDNVFDGDISFNDPEQYSAQIVLNRHKDLHRFGVASIKNGVISKIEEKPKELDPFFEQYAITGLYLFDQNFFQYFKCTNKSDRNEFEITDIIRIYRSQGELGYTIMDGVWTDAGTHKAIKELSDYFGSKE